MQSQAQTKLSPHSELQKCLSLERGGFPLSLCTPSPGKGSSECSLTGPGWRWAQPLCQGTPAGQCHIATLLSAHNTENGEGWLAPGGFLSSSAELPSASFASR